MANTRTRKMETHNVCGSRSDILKLIRTQINDPPAIPMLTTMSIQIMFHQDLQKETEVCWFVSRVYGTELGIAVILLTEWGGGGISA